jgi:CRP/FNR family transcriptional regulator, cyclic AMP receptor protein
MNSSRIVASITCRSEPMAPRVALHPFLAGMNRTQLTLLTDCAMPIHFNQGEMILHQGEQANRFYLIEKGKVVLEANGDSGERVIIEALGPGHLLGWSCLFPPYIWHFTARAVEPTEAIFFYGSIVREYCDHDHSLGYELFKRVSAIMIERLHAAREKMLAIRKRAPACSRLCNHNDRRIG